MIVTPAINCKSKVCAQKKIQALRSYIPSNSWVHVDIARRPMASINLSYPLSVFGQSGASSLQFEAHCMMPQKTITKIGVFTSAIKRIYVHPRMITDWDELLRVARQYKKEIGVVFDVTDSIKDIKVPSKIKHVIVLAVQPGKEGQKFDLRAWKIISALKKKYPQCILSLDGGIDEKNARRAKEKGIRKIISSSYLWNAEDFSHAFKKLKKI